MPELQFWLQFGYSPRLYRGTVWVQSRLYRGTVWVQSKLYRGTVWYSLGTVWLQSGYSSRFRDYVAKTTTQRKKIVVPKKSFKKSKVYTYRRNIFNGELPTPAELGERTVRKRFFGPQKKRSLYSTSSPFKKIRAPPGPKKVARTLCHMVQNTIITRG